MAGFNGRDFTFSWESTTLVGVRSRTMSITNDYVDVTTDDDSGWRTLLADPGTRSLEVSISGITSDEALIADIMAGTVAGKTLEGTLPTSLATAGTVSGTFLISSLERTGEHDGACEFSATFMSTGTVTYTASSA
jgi:TP901-1 family phage major tail protein